MGFLTRKNKITNEQKEKVEGIVKQTVKEDLKVSQKLVTEFNRILKDMTDEFNLQNKLLNENNEKIDNLKREITQLREQK